MNFGDSATFLVDDIRKRILTPNVDDSEIDDGGRLDRTRDDLRRAGRKVTDAATERFDR